MASVLAAVQTQTAMSTVQPLLARTSETGQAVTRPWLHRLHPDLVQWTMQCSFHALGKGYPKVPHSGQTPCPLGTPKGLPRAGDLETPRGTFLFVVFPANVRYPSLTCLSSTFVANPLSWLRRSLFSLLLCLLSWLSVYPADTHIDLTRSTDILFHLVTVILPERAPAVSMTSTLIGLLAYLSVT
ncbi:hypothetical protein B0J15DRAFT_26765 [Fusarium solani]|uniref:Uncharacterized protein n=1 Tax=Fusarium solani TaxID=169388 RepID=A0A9P9L7X0_FUSSL|nr:uncharacterized protein B0J15DRAFT_26765 [Fusarium solani]KAH7275837.1 hypothetical protein B0J15DRAFT_26765 [Fusarium solani]